MSVFDCISIMIPMIAAMFSLQFFSIISSIVPLPTSVAQPFLTVLIMYVLTYVYAKIQCWKSDKVISMRAIVPILLFIGWLAAFVFPLTAPFMMAFGNNPFFMVLLSLIYKLAYDSMFQC